MIVSWFMARRRGAEGVRPSALAVLWPLLIDLIALAGFAMLVVGVVVSAAYSEPRDDGAWPAIAMLGGIVIFAGCLSTALVTTWHSLRAR